MIPKLEQEDVKGVIETKEADMHTTTAAEAVDEKPMLGVRKQSPVIPSSSPPRPASEGLAAVANGSPTATRPASRLATSSQTSSAKGLNLLAAATREAEKESMIAPRAPSVQAQPKFTHAYSNGGYQQQQHYPGAQSQAQDPAYDEGEDEGIDLAK